MIEDLEDIQEELGPLLQLAHLDCKNVLNQLDGKEAAHFCGVEVSMLKDDLDFELAEGLLDFCATMPAGGARLNIMHTDLGSGTDCEQRLFDLAAERRMRETEKVWAEKLKRDSGKKKRLRCCCS